MCVLRTEYCVPASTPVRTALYRVLRLYGVSLAGSTPPADSEAVVQTGPGDDPTGQPSVCLLAGALSLRTGLLGAHSVRRIITHQTCLDALALEFPPPQALRLEDRTTRSHTEQLLRRLAGAARRSQMARRRADVSSSLQGLHDEAANAASAPTTAPEARRGHAMSMHACTRHLAGHAWLPSGRCIDTLSGGELR